MDNNILKLQLRCYFNRNFEIYPIITEHPIEASTVTTLKRLLHLKNPDTSGCYHDVSLDGWDC